MGRAKEAMLEAEDNWQAKAEAESWRCAVCSSVPPLSERDIYFETGMCGKCAHIAAKDD